MLERKSCPFGSGQPCRDDCSASMGEVGPWGSQCVIVEGLGSLASGLTEVSKSAVIIAKASASLTDFAGSVSPGLVGKLASVFAGGLGKKKGKENKEGAK